MPERILLYHIGGIGDTLVAWPAFRMIRATFPDARIDLLNLAVIPTLYHTQLYENTDFFERKIFLKPAPRIVSYARFAKAVLARKYDSLICFSFSDRPPVSLSLMFRLLHGNRIIHCAPHREFPDLPLALGYVKKLESFGWKRPEGDILRFPVTETEQKEAQTLKDSLPPLPLVAFGIGGNESVCRWPLERYDELVRRLLERHAFHPVWVGGPQDREPARFLTERYGGTFLADTVCRSLRGTIAFLQFCRGYVGNDTGSLHLASSAGIPCIGIYSAHNRLVQRWKGFSPGSIVLRHNSDCTGCEKRTCPIATPAPCLLTVTVDEVLAAAEKILFPGI